MATIVIHSITKEKISGTFCFEWTKTVASRSRYGTLSMMSRLVDRKKAKEIIEKNGLVESYSTRDGEVYDTPDGAFRALFPEGLNRKDEIEIIERLDRL